MKVQIKRLSPHQNGKVMGVMMGVTSLVFVVPMMIFVTMIPGAKQSGFPGSAFMFVFFPILYLVMGYIGTAIGCLIYNLICPYIGGIEYESTAEDAQMHAG
ncbi:hypothetical protein [Undibacterium sp.]|uniref:hypothetical protein n=1 Tax=Undibacterium sp. TaxID=1914977 RepID=UPI00374D0954